MTDLMIIVLVAAAILAPQVWAIRAWRGWWRRLAAAPLLVLGADILLILAQTSVDPTSHNLWPLELAMIAVVGLPVVGLLWMLRLVAKV
ncbi:MAG TPA: hypothetical protein VFG64_09080 [Dongiaceae bacterium]|nr:hypothetical protein [Dongiaceae bacterium]